MACSPSLGCHLAGVCAESAVLIAVLNIFVGFWDVLVRFCEVLERFGIFRFLSAGFEIFCPDF